MTFPIPDSALDDRQTMLRAVIRDVLTPNGRESIANGCRCIGCQIALDAVRLEFMRRYKV